MAEDLSRSMQVFGISDRSSDGAGQGQVPEVRGWHSLGMMEAGNA